MNICGIDPGKTGGIILLDKDSIVMDKTVMPMIGREIDHTGLKELFEYYKQMEDGVHCYLEKVNAFRGASSSSSFEFGRVFGAVESALRVMEIPVTYVTPGMWAKTMHQGLDRKLKPKDKSMITFRRLFPSVDLRTSEKATLQHDGLVDAILIAEYGRRDMVGA